MSLLSRNCMRIARPCSRKIVPSSVTTPASVSIISRRCQSSAAVDPKVSGIVDQIAKLTLLETADLVAALKSKLNIPDMALQSFAAAPAASAAPVAPAEEEVEQVQEKTMFNVKLESFDPASKPKIIKEVKALLGLSLVDSKKFVETAPKVLKEGLVKEEAEKIKKTLTDLGATVTLE